MSSENIKNSATDNLDEIPLKELILKAKIWLDYLVSRWLVILVFGIIGGLLGFTYAYFNKPVYTATTTFVLEEGNSAGAGALGNLGGLASMVGIDIGGGGGIFTGDNILELYKSRSMIQKALLTKANFEGKQQLLIDRYIESNELTTKWTKIDWTKISFLEPAKFTVVHDSIIGLIIKDINKRYLSVVKPDKKLSIIRVDVKSQDESFAKIFDDRIVESVNQFYIDTKTKRSVDNVNILQHKTDSVRAVMNGAIYSAARVNDETPNLNPTRQTQRVAPIQKSQFSAETNKAVLTELLKNLEMSKMALLKEAPLIQIVDKPIFPLDKLRFGKAKGIVLGGVLMGFLAVFILIIRKLFKEILS